MNLGIGFGTQSEEHDDSEFCIGDYVYNPKEARLRKALRDQGRQHRPRQKWKPPAAQHSTLTPVVQDLKRVPAIDSWMSDVPGRGVAGSERLSDLLGYYFLCTPDWAVKSKHKLPA
ncbi:hypothetical protein AAG570_011585 [Ranatra chinensis]|uniref:Uncharacterized protein n=1 Tax=Ranatra chinensis TaxID=642074 RepID=A0ABD0YN69_9HEMI